MKFRHAALALLAWLLMVRPSNRDDAPLSEWTVSHSYVSEEACESALNKSRDQASAKLGRYDSMTEQQRDRLQHDQKAFDEEQADKDSFDVAFRSACIASDDPRLKEK